MLSIPLAVPEKIIGLTPILDFFDRCDSFASLHPPPAALGSLPLFGNTQQTGACNTEILRHFRAAVRAPASLALLRKISGNFCRTAAATKCRGVTSRVSGRTLCAEAQA